MHILHGETRADPILHFCEVDSVMQLTPTLRRSSSLTRSKILSCLLYTQHTSIALAYKLDFAFTEIFFNKYSVIRDSRLQLKFIKYIHRIFAIGLEKSSYRRKNVEERRFWHF